MNESLHSLLSLIVGMYLSGGGFLGVIGLFLLAHKLVQAQNSGNKVTRILTVPARFLLAVVFIVHLLWPVALLFGVPHRMPEYNVRDGLCDYDGEPATVGLERVLKSIVRSGPVIYSNYDYKVRRMEAIGDGTVIGEYCKQHEWIAYFEKMKADSENLKCVLPVLFIVWIIFAGIGAWFCITGNNSLQEDKV